MCRVVPLKAIIEGAFQQNNNQRSLSYEDIYSYCEEHYKPSKPRQRIVFNLSNSDFESFLEENSSRYFAFDNRIFLLDRTS